MGKPVRRSSRRGIVLVIAVLGSVCLVLTCVHGIHVAYGYLARPRPLAGDARFELVLEAEESFDGDDASGMVERISRSLASE